MLAVVLAAGFGTRMRPLTYYLHKALVPVGGKPLLEHIVLKLKAQGITDIIVAASHLHDQVEHYLGDGSQLGVRMRYSISSEPLGTAGEISHLADKLQHEESFVVHYGDIITDLDLPAMIAAHQADSERICTVGFVQGVPMHFGVGRFADDGAQLRYFVEKPPADFPCHAAIQIFRRRALSYMRPGLDIATDVVPAMMAAGERVCGFLDPTAFWHDVGRLSDLEEMEKLLAAGKAPRW